MAGKKDEKNFGSTMRDNPFKALKGLSVSAPEKPATIRPVAAARPAAADEPANFTEEMARLGVRRMSAPAAGEPPQPEPAKVEDQPTPPASDEELFAAALGKLDSVFTDHFPGEDAGAAATPRRMKLLSRGKLMPEATLDLHGLGRDEARDRVRHFLDNSVYHGRKTVLIVTGRGLRSNGEPVLRGDIERYLDGEGRAWVAEWGRAPRQFGGEGALAVFLKTADKRIPPRE
jgi:DNA-nicking Smr family endonuclease